MAARPMEEQQQRVEHLLEMVGLAGMGGRSVYDLSGGEQQRVALARALAPAPRLLLLDEPLGALDRTLRERLMDELRSILKRASAELGGQEKVTTLYVTHDQEEAFAVAGRVVVMNKGRIEQSGSPLDLYRSPATPFVARFLGMDNLLEAEVVSQQPGLVDAAVGRVEIGERIIAPTGSKGTLLIRPEAAKVLSPGESGKNEMSAEIKDISFRGRYQIVMITVRHNNHSTSLKLSFDMEQSLPTPGGQLRLTLQPEKCRFFPME
jgi:ABC-type Fe3+/spermidine/putrescine transport system ATPase subunit